MIWFLSAIETEALEQGLTHHIDYPTNNYFDIQEKDINKQIQSISFIDDSLFPIIGDASQIMEKLKILTKIIHNNSLIFHLKMDYKMGKTQPMIKFRSKFAVSEKQQLATQQNIIKIQYENTDINLIACSVYKHLGIMTTPDLSLGPELQADKKWLHGKITPNIRNLLKNKEVCLQQSKLLLLTLLASGLIYGTATWSHYTKSNIDAFHILVLRAYRLLLPNKFSKNADQQNLLSDWEVIQQLELPLPINIIRIQKFQLLTKLIQKQHSTLLYLLGFSIKTPNSWLQGLTEDIKTLWPIICEDEDIVSPSNNIVHWFINNKMTLHKKTIKKNCINGNTQKLSKKRMKKRK